jgi:hypothetical protein
MWNASLTRVPRVFKLIVSTARKCSAAVSSSAPTSSLSIDSQHVLFGLQLGQVAGDGQRKQRHQGGIKPERAGCLHRSDEGRDDGGRPVRELSGLCCDVYSIVREHPALGLEIAQDVFGSGVEEVAVAGHHDGRPGPAGKRPRSRPPQR